jgi:hypothetical protein
LLLALLRAGTLVVLVLLLVNPSLPTAARQGRGSGTAVILDASLSMELPSSEGGTRWDRALARAQRESASSTILLMGGVPRRVPRDSLAAVKPFYGESRLLPALQAAAEGGASKAIVISDGGIEDYQEVQRWLPRLGITLEVVPVGEGAANDRSLTELVAPSWAEAGKPVQVRVGVTATGDGGGPVSVTITSAGQQVAATTLPAPPPGRVSTATLEFSPAPPPGGGLVRYEVGIAPADAIPANDKRTLYLFVGDRPAGVALVSFVPDWEPRFLQPVLEQSLGLPVRSFLRASGTTFVRGGTGTEAGQRANEDQVRTAVSEANLLVVHGAGAGLPAWALEALRTKSRVLVFPRESGANLELLEIPPASVGDWFVASDIPASPIAGLLAGLPVENLAPLLALNLPRSMPAGSWTPLLAGRGRRGAQAPIAVAGGNGGKRWAVALGVGYWRWAFRGGDQRQAYSRLFGALAGWLVQEQGHIAGGAVRPTTRVAERGRRLGWVAPGLAADSIRLRVRAGERMVADTTIPVEEGDTALSSALAPGNYNYEARVFAGGREVGSGSGPLTVDAYSAELTRPARPLASLRGLPSAAGIDLSRRGERPLRTLIWPYVLAVLLLATEWTLRRRWGLR